MRCRPLRFIWFAVKRTVFKMRLPLAIMCAIIVATTYFSSQTMNQMVEIAKRKDYMDLTELNLCVVEKIIEEDVYVTYQAEPCVGSNPKLCLTTRNRTTVESGIKHVNVTECCFGFFTQDESSQYPLCTPRCSTECTYHCSGLNDDCSCEPEYTGANCDPDADVDQIVSERLRAPNQMPFRERSKREATTADVTVNVTDKSTFDEKETQQNATITTADMNVISVASFEEMQQNPTIPAADMNVTPFEEMQQNTTIPATDMNVTSFEEMQQNATIPVADMNVTSFEEMQQNATIPAADINVTSAASFEEMQQNVIIPVNSNDYDHKLNASSNHEQIVDADNAKPTPRKTTRELVAWFSLVIGGSLILGTIVRITMKRYELHMEEQRIFGNCSVGMTTNHPHHNSVADVNDVEQHYPFIHENVCTNTFNSLANHRFNNQEKRKVNVAPSPPRSQFITQQMFQEIQRVFTANCVRYSDLLKKETDVNMHNFENEGAAMTVGEWQRSSANINSPLPVRPASLTLSEVPTAIAPRYSNKMSSKIESNLNGAPQQTNVLFPNAAFGLEESSMSDEHDALDSGHSVSNLKEVEKMENKSEYGISSVAIVEAKTGPFYNINIKTVEGEATTDQGKVVVVFKMGI